MADESMQMPGDGEPDVLTGDMEVPVRLDSLEADGTRPSVGDQVTVKIDGVVKSIENDCAYITPQMVNDTDINELNAMDQNDDDMMANMTRQADQQGTPMGSGGYG